ncbi:MAG: hypothetical protein QM820_06480 [Minicystis sp.]
MPELAVLLKVMIQRQDATIAALGETNAAVRSLAGRQDEMVAAVKDLAAEVRGTNRRLDGVHSEVHALREEIRATVEQRLQRLEAAVFKTAAE